MTLRDCLDKAKVIALFSQPDLYPLTFETDLTEDAEAVWGKLGEARNRWDINQAVWKVLTRAYGKECLEGTQWAILSQAIEDMLPAPVYDSRVDLWLEVWVEPMGL